MVNTFTMKMQISVKSSISLVNNSQKKKILHHLASFLSPRTPVSFSFFHNFHHCLFCSVFWRNFLCFLFYFRNDYILVFLLLLLRSLVLAARSLSPGTSFLSISLFLLHSKMILFINAVHSWLLLKIWIRTVWNDLLLLSLTPLQSVSLCVWLWCISPPSSICASFQTPATTRQPCLSSSLRYSRNLLGFSREISPPTRV